MPPRIALARAHVTRIFASITAIVATSFFATTDRATAGQIDIHVTGLNLVYNGTNIYDAGGSAGGAGDPAQSDALSSMSFFVEGNLVGSVLTSDIFADILIEDVLNIPVGGGVVTSGGNGNAFGFDFLTQNQVGGWGLDLDIDELQVFYTGNKIAIAGAGLASSLSFQDLPFGIVFDPAEPITIAFSTATLGNVTSSGGYLTGFMAAGTANVAGVELEIMIPEPGTLLLTSLGLIATAVVTGRRRA